MPRLDRFPSAAGVAATLLQPLAFVCFDADRGVQAETVDLGAQRLTRSARRGGLGRIVARHRLHKGEVVLSALPADAQRAHRRVLLVHGWNAASSDWALVARQLAARGMQVYVTDMPGHGAARGRTSSLPRFFRALEAIDR